METLHVDCGSCAVRGRACSDCVISVLLGPPAAAGAEVELADAERSALHALAGGGLVPPLRLVPPVTGEAAGQAGDEMLPGASRAVAL